MMNGGRARGGVPAKQGALSDITNTHGKRALPMESEKTSASNKFVRYRGTFGGIKGMTKGKEKINLELEVIEDGLNPKGKGLSLLNAKGPCQPLSLDIGVGSIQNKVGLHISEDDNVEADRPMQGCVSLVSVPGLCNNTRESSPELVDCREDNVTDRENSLQLDIQTEKGHDKSSSASYRVLDSVVVRGKKVDGAECLTGDVGGLLKASVPCNVEPSNNCGGTTCSDEIFGCSFCLKAAYMWMDLHYQDTRGRLTALQKSKKFARSLEARCYGHDPSDNIPPDKSKRCMEEDFELMQHCRSLFLHTENVLVHEIAQLQSNLVRLKEEKEDCKSRLENISVVHPSK